jgi:hypothetical protein
VPLPAGHWQEPAAQLDGLPQRVPHEPQLKSSLARDVQSVPHASGWPGSPQVHAPWTHVWLLEQPFPQPPQLEPSLWVSTHSPSHAVVPAASHSQRPDMHFCALPQTLPQAPQLFGSVTDTDTPLHVWQASTTPSQSWSTPSMHEALGSGTQAQMGCETSGDCTHRQLTAAGQSWSVSHERVHTPPDASTRTHSSEAQSSVSEQD